MPESLSRRTFSKTLITFGALAPLARFARQKEPVIGHGAYRYRVDAHWCRADSLRHPVKDCHELAMDRKGLLYMTTNDTRNNILVMNKDGVVVNAWGTAYPGAHGLTLHDENGTEFLYITDYERHAVIKTTLDGRVVREFGWPAESGKYPDATAFKPTETAIGPDGSVFIADGYGQDFIVHYDADGRLLNLFGGKDGTPSGLANAHGVALDVRKPDKPVLLVSSRAENTLKVFSLQGEWLRSIPLPGAYICRPVVHGQAVYFAVLISRVPWDSASGYLCILDENFRVVSAPGGSIPQYDGQGALSTLYQTVKIFRHPHDVLVDPDGNLFVAEWNAGGIYPYRLTRVS